MLRRSLASGRSVRDAGSAGLNFYPINGESLALGQTPTLISSTPSAQHKMFAGGVRPQYTAAAEATWYTSLAALKEQADAAAPWDTALRETPCVGAAEIISQLITAENGAAAAAAHTMLMSSPGYGGQTVASLSPPSSAHFARLIRQCEEGFGLSSALSLATQAQGLVLGVNDYVAGTTRAACSVALQQLATDFASFARGGRQSFLAPTFVAQVASHLYLPTPTPSIALAQTDAATALPSLLSVACPMYQFDYPTGDWHLDAASSKWLGAYLGLAYKRRVYDGVAWDGAMKIVSATRNGNGIDVVTDAIGQLTLDTTWVTALADGNYGIQVVDSGGAPVAVTGVSIVGANGLRVACTAGGGAGSVLRAGWAGTAAETGPGRATGARTNIRDSYGDTLAFTVDVGDTRPMHRWLAISEVATT